MNQYSEIQAVFDAKCVGGHGDIDTYPSANLSLVTTNSYVALFDVTSLEQNEIKLVVAGDINTSYLWYKSGWIWSRYAKGGFWRMGRNT